MLNEKNTITVSVTILLAFIALFATIVVAHHKAEDTRIERQITERARVEACRTIDDDMVKINCILATKAAAVAGS